ncbi:DeoR family transcriptional regulator [Marinomonas primoryensis]|nr:DeoR family transcriptional regulator [Marinomonas primoryensis]
MSLRLRLIVRPIAFKLSALMSKEVKMTQRRQKILLLLELNEQVSSRELSHRLHVSYDIIINDMIYLEKAGLLRRIEGGAIVLEEGSEVDDK